MGSNFTISTVFTAVDRMSGTMGKIEKQGLTMGKAFAAIGGVAALGAMASAGMDLSARMTRLGTSMDIPADKTKALTASILDISKSPKINIDSSGLISAVEQVAERTGDFEFAKDNLESMALAIQATGAAGEDIGGMFSEFQKMGLGAAEAMSALDALTVQGKKGAFTMGNLAALGPRTIAAYSATGRTGVDALREMGAALQVIRQGTGSSEMAATAFEAVMRELTDPKKQKMLRQMGVAVRDAGGQFRPVTDIMTDIVTKSGGSIEKIGQVFDAEAVRGFNTAVAEFQKTGAVSSFAEFMKITGDGSTILADSARNAAEAKAQITALQTELMVGIDDAFVALGPSLITTMQLMKPLIEGLAASVNQITGFIGGDNSNEKNKRQSVGVTDMFSDPGAAMGKLWDNSTLESSLASAGTYGMSMNLNDWQIERLAGLTNKEGVAKVPNLFGLGASANQEKLKQTMAPDQYEKYQAVMNNTYEMKTNKETGKQEIVITLANFPAGTGTKQSGNNPNLTLNMGAAKAVKN